MGSETEEEKIAATLSWAIGEGAKSQGHVDALRRVARGVVLQRGLLEDMEGDMLCCGGRWLAVARVLPPRQLYMFFQYQFIHQSIHQSMDKW